MRSYMIFHPGAGYSTNWRAEDVETYDTFGEALRAFDRLPDPFYPCAYPDAAEGEGAEGWIFFYDPRTEDGSPADEDSDDYDPEADVVDVYPDRIVTYGPRGGVRWTHA